jgi:DNA-binding transcriptional LysR family regulator
MKSKQKSQAWVNYGKKLSGTIRITCAEHPAKTVLWPKLEKFLPKYPDIKVEVNIDYGLTDIVAERFDAGVRLGEQVARDMIAVRIGPDMRIAVVGAPSYFKGRAMPKTPQDLTHHNCLNLRLPTRGVPYVWEFEKRGRELKVRVDGQLIMNNLDMRLNAVLAGNGLAYLPEDVVLPYIAKGKLIRVLDDWCAPFAGYHLYYANRRHHTAAFTALLDVLKHQN